MKNMTILSLLVFIVSGCFALLGTAHTNLTVSWEPTSNPRVEDLYLSNNSSRHHRQSKCLFLSSSVNASIPIDLSIKHPSCLPTPTKVIYRYLTVTHMTSTHKPLYSSYTSPSILSITLATPTTYSYLLKNSTARHTFTEPGEIKTAKAWVSTILDIGEICYRVLNVLLTFYNIRVTMKLLGT